MTDNAPGVFAPVAKVFDPVSGRTLTISTTEPGLQYYNGYYLDCSPPAGKGGARYGRKSGFALETQHWPDAPNRPGFPSVIVRPGEVFRTVTEWEFGVWSSV